MVVSLYVQPRASRSELVGWHDGALKVALKAPPVDGKANVELVRLLAHVAGISKRRVRLLSGHGSRRKRVLLEGVLLEHLEETLPG